MRSVAPSPPLHLMLDPRPADDWRLLQEARDLFSGVDTLFERHKDYVFRLAWGFLGEQDAAEDVTQEVFLRVAKGRGRWRARAKFRTLLYQITLNACREVRRRRGRDLRFASGAEAEEPVATAPDPRLTDLARALGGLSDRQREAVVLRFYEGLDTRETARVMGCREGTVKSHLHRALETLRRTMEPEEPEADHPMAGGLSSS